MSDTTRNTRLVQVDIAAALGEPELTVEHFVAVARFHEAMKARGIDVTLTHEPGEAPGKPGPAVLSYRGTIPVLQQLQRDFDL